MNPGSIAIVDARYWALVGKWKWTIKSKSENWRKTQGALRLLILGLGRKVKVGNKKQKWKVKDNLGSIVIVDAKYWALGEKWVLTMKIKKLNPGSIVYVLSIKYYFSMQYLIPSSKQMQPLGVSAWRSPSWLAILAIPAWLIDWLGGYFSFGLLAAQYCWIDGYCQLNMLALMFLDATAQSTDSPTDNCN